MAFDGAAGRSCSVCLKLNALQNVIVAGALALGRGRDAFVLQMNGCFYFSDVSLLLRPSAGQKQTKKLHIFFKSQQSEFGRVGVEVGVTRQQI